MGLQYRKSKALTKSTRANISRSGVSLSKRVGPLTLNSRGRGSLRILPGLSFRFGKANPAMAIVALSAVAVAALIRLTVLVLVSSTMLVWWLLKWAVLGTAALVGSALLRRQPDGPDDPATQE
jgi:hypothetical protein